MHRKMRSMRKAVAGRGAPSARVCLHVKVHVAPEKPDDIVDHVPDMQFRVIDPRLQNRKETRGSLPARLDQPLILAGGGLRTTIRLSGSCSFALVSAIKEIHIRKAETAV